VALDAAVIAAGPVPERVRSASDRCAGRAGGSPSGPAPSALGQPTPRPAGDRMPRPRGLTRRSSHVGERPRQPGLSAQPQAESELARAPVLPSAAMLFPGVPRFPRVPPFPAVLFFPAVPPFPAVLFFPAVPPFPAVLVFPAVPPFPAVLLFPAVPPHAGLPMQPGSLVWVGTLAKAGAQLWRVHVPPANRHRALPRGQTRCQPGPARRPQQGLTWHSADGPRRRPQGSHGPSPQHR
jgi:hypothetical protein